MWSHTIACRPWQALATHEPHFSLLREQIDFKAFKNAKGDHGTKTATRRAADTKWQLLHVGLLREYLEMDMRPLSWRSLPFRWDGERCIDDFVLLTALCGNDFIPHLASLDIGEGALDHLLRYVACVFWGDGSSSCVIRSDLRHTI